MNKQGKNQLKKSFDMLLGTEVKSDLEVYVVRRAGKSDPTLIEQEEEKNDE